MTGASAGALVSWRGAWLRGPAWVVAAWVSACAEPSSTGTPGPAHGALVARDEQVRPDAGRTGETPDAGQTEVAAPISADRGVCDPCTASPECAALGKAGVCAAAGAPVGSAGHFCALPCVEGRTGCGEGLVCTVTSTAEGVSGAFCLPAAGPCPCSASAVAHGWTTPCFRVAYAEDGAPLGMCAGTQTCAASGVPACSAAEPAAETCNGQDDDCDGVTDGVAADGTACSP